MQGNGGQHGSFIEFEVGGQLDPDEFEPLHLRADGVHDKTGHRCEQGSARHIASDRQQPDQLVRPVTQHDVKALGHDGVVRQFGAQLVDTAIGVTVESQRTQTLAQRGLQGCGEPVRVFHGVELEHAGGVLHGVGVHRLNVSAYDFLELGVQLGHGFNLISGTVCKRSSAARACACRPSP